MDYISLSKLYEIVDKYNIKRDIRARKDIEKESFNLFEFHSIEDKMPKYGETVFVVAEVKIDGVDDMSLEFARYIKDEGWELRESNYQNFRIIKWISIRDFLSNVYSLLYE